MMPPLPAAFLETPLAHRGLHDAGRGRPENSRAAIRAAIAAGYGIEIDLQMSADKQALVFHDDDLDRVAEGQGPVRALQAHEAADMVLKGGGGEGIPPLSEVLGIIAGQVPLLIEIKDQDGQMGPDVGPLEAAAAAALAGYEGPVAVMSFNPHSVAEMARLAPDVPRGLVTSAYDTSEWDLPPEICKRLRKIPDFRTCGAGFISHEASDLGRPRVQELREAGVPVLCWTIRSAEEEGVARVFADNVTFEGYLPG